MFPVMVAFKALQPWLPQSILSLRHYRRDDFIHDLVAVQRARELVGGSGS